MPLLELVNYCWAERDDFLGDSPGALEVAVRDLSHTNPATGTYDEYPLATFGDAPVATTPQSTDLDHWWRSTSWTPRPALGTLGAVQLDLTKWQGKPIQLIFSMNNALPKGDWFQITKLDVTTAPAWTGVVDCSDTYAQPWTVNPGASDGDFNSGWGSTAYTSGCWVYPGTGCAPAGSSGIPASQWQIVAQWVLAALTFGLQDHGLPGSAPLGVSVSSMSNGPLASWDGTPRGRAWERRRTSPCPTTCTAAA